MTLRINNKKFELNDDNYFNIVGSILNLTPKETIYLKHLVNNGEITSINRKSVAETIGCTIEEVNTYISRLRKKKAIVKNSYHTLFSKPCNIEIEWEY